MTGSAKALDHNPLAEGLLDFRVRDPSLMVIFGATGDLSARKLLPTSRTSAVISAQSEVSFGAYFNAFAAGYWRRWSRLTEVHLRLDVEGTGRVDVYIPR